MHEKTGGMVHLRQSSSLMWNNLSESHKKAMLNF